MCGCTSSDCADAGLGQHVLRGFNAAIGRAEAKRTRSEMQSWHVARHTNQTLVQPAECANPRVQGWINCCGAISGSALHSILRPLNDHLVRWARRKYKRLGRRRRQYTAPRHQPALLLSAG